ncbi:Uncharacterised protein [Bordetella pertussis]|nr:Uncharacterised protein [Bordetella pertussis]CPO74704.1 Uncharacterised protein [Bordetella pertussis]CPP56804.1 Uncharacterised protein [Bordetella pertussis]CRE33640.1 Uncharacterised protein [Bordetella pertussis]
MNFSRRATRTLAASGCCGLISRLQSGTPRHGTMALGSCSRAEPLPRTQASPMRCDTSANGTASQKGWRLCSASTSRTWRASYTARGTTISIR